MGASIRDNSIDNWQRAKLMSRGDTLLASVPPKPSLPHLASFVSYENVSCRYIIHIVMIPSSAAAPPSLILS